MKNLQTFEEFLNESQTEELYEGHMSELNILAQEAKDFEAFIKSAIKEYPQIKKEKNFTNFLKDIYDQSINDTK